MSNPDRGLYRRRGSPNWSIRYAGPSGKVIRESTGTSQKKLARQILAKRKVLVAEGRHLERKKIPKATFFQLCEQYWEIAGKHKPMKGLDSMIAAWKTAFGNVPLKDLDQKKVEQFLSRFDGSKGKSFSTRNRHLTMLRSVFNKAIE